MAVTGGTKYDFGRHIFWGVPAPVNADGTPPSSITAGDMWVVTPLLQVTAGTPGSFTPATDTPANLAALNVFGALNQRNPWTPGQYVVLGDNSEAYWGGSNWLLGRAPLPNPTGIIQGNPGSFIPAGTQVPANLAALNALGRLGQTTEWRQPGDHVVLGDGSQAYWDGTRFVAGRVPPVQLVVVSGSPGSYLDQYGIVHFRPDPFIPTTLAAIRALGSLGATTRWSTGQHILTNDGTEVYWDGAQWQPGRVPAPLSTTVTPGSPGTFGPGTPPANLGELNTITPNPSTPWQPGQHVVVGGNNYHWNGTSWVTGVTPAPLASTVTPGAPGTFGPVNTVMPSTKAQLDTINGGAAWTVPGNYVEVGGVDYYWNGTSWILGRVPTPLATTATAGTPGSFGPAGTVAPTNSGQLAGITAVPATPWSTGQYVVVGGADHYWTGTAWAPGRAPAPALANQAVQGIPGHFLPAGAPTPTTKAQLDTVNGGAAWTTPGAWIFIGPQKTDEYYWNGTSWVAGRVPGVAQADKQLQITPWNPSLRPLPASPDALPNVVMLYVDRVGPPPSMSLIWSPLTLPAGMSVRNLSVRITNSGGTEKWRTSTGTIPPNNEMTLSMNTQTVPNVTDFVYMEFMYSDGTVATFRGEVIA